MSSTALQATASWPAVLVGAMLVASWGADRDARPLVLRVDDTTTNEEFVQRGMALLGKRCTFAWGDVPELPSATPGVFAWPDGQIEGWFVCGGEDFDRLLQDPRRRSVMVVTYIDGTLWGSHHLSDDHRWPIAIPDQPSEERRGLLAAFITDDHPGLILPTLRAVRWMPRVAQISLLF